MSKRALIRVVQVEEGTEDVNKIMSRLVSIHLSHPKDEEKFSDETSDHGVA